MNVKFQNIISVNKDYQNKLNIYDLQNYEILYEFFFNRKKIVKFVKF